MGKNKITVEGIETAVGNDIISKMKSEGWKVSSQYSSLMFDKGIDYDFYTLKKNGIEIKFEWDNWFEWKIQGAGEAMVELSKKYALNIKKPKE